MFLPTAHPTLIMAGKGTPQYLALRKGDTKQYMTTKVRILWSCDTLRSLPRTCGGHK
jgi:hypothetical protein